MGEGYRDETEAALHRAEALRRENEELKRRVARAERAASADARIAALQQENAELRARLATRDANRAAAAAARPADAHHAPSNTAAVVAVSGLLVLVTGFVAAVGQRRAAPRGYDVARAARWSSYEAAAAAQREARAALVPVAPESQLGRLAIRVVPGAARGLHVTVDGAPVAMTAGRGVTAPLDARGDSHVLVASAEGFAPVTMPVWARSGQVEAFTVRLFPREPAPRR